MSHELTYKYLGCEGWDSVLRLILTRKAFTRHLARKLLRTVYRDLDLKAHTFIIVMPEGPFRVLDRAGRVERVRHPELPVVV